MSIRGGRADAVPAQGQGRCRAGAGSPRRAAAAPVAAVGGSGVRARPAGGGAESPGAVGTDIGQQHLGDRAAVDQLAGNRTGRGRHVAGAGRSPRPGRVVAGLGPGSGAGGTPTEFLIMTRSARSVNTHPHCFGKLRRGVAQVLHCSRYSTGRGRCAASLLLRGALVEMGRGNARNALRRRGGIWWRPRRGSSRNAGYAGTSISDISARSGRTSGAIYFHFANKEKLALAVVEATFATWHGPGRSAPARWRRSPRPPRARASPCWRSGSRSRRWCGPIAR